VSDQARRLHDEVLDLMPAGATHDRVTCPFCADSAQQSEPPLTGESGRSDAPTTVPDRTEGGSTQAVEDTRITQETHDALVRAAVDQATADLARIRDELQTQLTDATSERDAVKAEAAGLTEDNERLNTELDAAQVQLKSATDAKADLDKQLTDLQETSRLSEVAATRAAQVRNLGLFTEEHIAEKASRWAAVPDEEWAERIEEWKAVQGESPTTDTDSASALTGSSEGTTARHRTASARRRVLGLK